MTPPASHLPRTQPMRAGRRPSHIAGVIMVATVTVVAAMHLPCMALGDPGGLPATRRAISEDPSSVIEPLFREARYDSLLRTIDGYLRAAEEHSDSLLLGRMLVQRGRVQLMTGDLMASVRSIDAGIDVAIAAHDTAGWMPALTFKGYALAANGRYEEAMACYQLRLDLAQRTGSSLDEAWALTNIAYVMHRRGDQQAAGAGYTRAIELFRAGGRGDLELTPLVGLGRVNSAVGDTQQAMQCYQRAWIVARSVGDRENEVWAANNLGALESLGGDMGRAIAYAQHAYQVARAMGYPRGAILPAINIASWRMEMGEYARAQAILEDAEKFYAQSGDDEFLAKIQFHKARLALHRGEHGRAAGEFRRLLAEGRLEPQNADFAWVELASALALSDSIDVARGHWVLCLCEPSAHRSDTKPLQERAATPLQWNKHHVTLT